MLSDYVTIAYTIKHQKKNKGGKGLSPPSTGTRPPLTIEPQLSTTLHILCMPYPSGDLYAL